MILQDAKAEYIVIVLHDQYEQSVYFFQGEQAARDMFTKENVNGNEVYISKILTINGGYHV